MMMTIKLKTAEAIFFFAMGFIAGGWVATGLGALVELMARR